MNLTNHLRRRIVLAALTGTVIVGAAGAAHADIAPRVTPETAAPATGAADAPTPSGWLLAAVTAPTAPRSVTAKAGNTTVKLAWLAPSSSGGSPVNKYRVQRARAGGAWKNIAYPTTRSYTATGLINGARYRFRVAAHNAAGWGPFSTAVKAVPRTVPSAPRSPTATPGNGTVTLAWLRPSSNGGATISKYRVQRATSAVGPWKSIAYPTTRGYTAGGLTNGTRYHFRIAAHNTAGWSKPSTVVNAVPLTVPSAPLAPVATPGNSSVTLSWQPPSNNGGAKIEMYRVQQQGLFGAWNDVASLTGLSYTATQLGNGSTYTYRVLAYNIAGWGTPTLPVQAVPFTSPAAPLKLTATSGKDWINLTWNPPLGDGGRPVQGYLIYRSASLNGPYGQIKYTPNLSYLEPGLAPGTAYHYKVYACNVAGCGPQSNIASANVPTLPSTPATCQATQLNGKGSDWVRIQWTPPSSNGGGPILNYSVQITDFGNQAIVYKTAQPVGNATVTDIYMPADTGASEQNGKYYYSVFVAAKNAAGVGPWCGEYLVMEP